MIQPLATPGRGGDAFVNAREEHNCDADRLGELCRHLSGHGWNGADVAIAAAGRPGALRELAQGGGYQPWSEWFGPAAIAGLIPDDDMRAVVLADMPALPLAFFEERVPVPAGWEAQVWLRAAERGLRRAGGQGRSQRLACGPPGRRHLGIVTRAEDVAEAIISVFA